jgi:hypothetical protein
VVRVYIGVLLVVLVYIGVLLVVLVYIGVLLVVRVYIGGYCWWYSFPSMNNEGVLLVVLVSLMNK